MVHNMEELSTFFKRQVLLSRFIGQFAHGESITSNVKWTLFTVLMASQAIVKSPSGKLACAAELIPISVP